MEVTNSEVMVKGRKASVPSLTVDGRKIVSEGKWLRIARVHDEVWLEGQPVEDPARYLAAVKSGNLRADIFSFAEVLPQTEPRHKYNIEWENFAVADTTDFKAWWEGMPQESRKNVRRSERRGAVTKPVDFDDTLVKGIKEMYDETPVRQGRRFWHYGKDFETVKRENSTYLDRCQFIGVFHKEELIGFMKMVYVDSTARIMQILSKNQHYDKRPTNAMLAKAMEICNKRGMKRLIYGQYIYDNKKDSPVTEFKRRNGFSQVLVPRYYIPLTAKGRVAVATRLHCGIKSRLPAPVLSSILSVRNSIYEKFVAKSKGAAAAPEKTAESGDGEACGTQTAK